MKLLSLLLFGLLAFASCSSDDERETAASPAAQQQPQDDGLHISIDTTEIDPVTIKF